MALFFNRVAFFTATTGTGTVNVGEAITDAFLTPAEAGAENSDSPIPYLILDGADFEIGVGTYSTGSPPTFSRDTVTSSKISGTAGTSKINLSGEAQVRFAGGADELAAFSTFDGAYLSLSGIPSTFAPSAHGHTLSDISDAGTAAAASTSAFATAAQGGLADTALQTGSHAAVSVIGRSANSSGDAADIAAGANDRILARVSNALSWVQLTIGMVPDGLITAAKMASGVLTTSPSNAQTANYTLVLADAGKTVRMSNSSARTITIPPNSSVAFPVDTIVNFETVGTGDCTIAAGSGVTIRSRNGLKLAGQYAVATAHKIDTNEWILAGDLTT